MASMTFPTMRYVDAPAMIDWLCRVIGFARHAVHEDGSGGILHAELALGDGMIMLGSAKDEAYGAMLTTPQAAGGVTQAAYLAMSDAEVEAAHARAVEAGAEIVSPLRTESFGGRAFALRDPEGHIWHLGGYDPRA